MILDKAVYQALIVAYGSSRSDRQFELVVLFQLLRSDARFPSAVALGQYTKAIAEEFWTRSSNRGNLDEDDCACFVGKIRMILKCFQKD